jgi:hypothetical protein
MPTTHLPSPPARWLTWDRLGIAASGLCLVHCVATPLLVLVASAADSLLVADRWVHPVMLLLVAPLAAVALVRGHRRHHHAPIAVLGSTGVGAIAFGALGSEQLLGSTVEVFATIAGSLLVIAAHCWNLFRLARCSGHAHR